MLFCAKNKRRQTKYKAKAGVKILIAIALLTHCFSRVCIATKQKREQFAKHAFVPKTTKRMQKICTKKDG